MVRKWQGLLWAIGMVSGMAASAAAQELPSPSSPVLPVGDRPQPATTVKDWLAQIEATAVQVTGVKLERSETRLDIVLETAEGKPLQVDATKFRTEGNSLIAEIPNAVLALPEGQAFTAENPAADIASVQVAQQDVNTIRVSVAGTSAPPTTEVTLKTGGLAYSLNPAADEPDEEIVVTGERQQGYRVPNASTGSRTDTPIRDLPFSVQVVPLELLQDRQVQRVNEALRTIAGVTPGQSSQSAFEEYIIRGFSGNFAGGNILRNGLRDDSNISGIALPNIEQIEVLKGPAGALFGQGSSGGTVNELAAVPIPLRVGKDSPSM
jgi:iron complex outermembrane receptor protein